MGVLTENKVRLQEKLDKAFTKNNWVGVVDACNAELYTFKSTLSEVTKLASGGKVCFVDPSQRGLTMKKGMDPDDCPLQVIQLRVLGDINAVFSIASGKHQLDPAAPSYAAFLADFDAFASAVAAAA